jgi:hypothetical protein
MKISAFTKIFVLGGAAFLALSQGSFGRGGGHGGGGRHFGGGHFGGGRFEGFHGGRLPTASRASRQAVQRQPEVSSRARLASHNSGSQLGSLGRGESTVRNPTADRRGGTTDSAANLHRDTTAQAAELSRDHSPQHG